MAPYNPKPNAPTWVPGGPTGMKKPPKQGSVPGTPSYRDPGLSKDENLTPGKNNAKRLPNGQRQSITPPPKEPRYGSAPRTTPIDSNTVRSNAYRKRISSYKAV